MELVLVQTIASPPPLFLPLNKPVASILLGEGGRESTITTVVLMWSSPCIQSYVGDNTTSESLTPNLAKCGSLFPAARQHRANFLEDQADARVGEGCSRDKSSKTSIPTQHFSLYLDKTSVTLSLPLSSTRM